MIRLAVRVRREQAELVLADLLAVAPGGVEEVDLGDRVEYAIYGAEGELPALGEVHAAAGEALVEVVTSEVADDWSERWRDFHQPIDVGPLHVRAPWHPEPSGDRVDIVIDPGQAFGTGAHDTTRLCLELLSGLGPPEVGLQACGYRLAPEGPPPSVLDLGCGSGVLAIAAAKLGYGPVLGIDHERESVAATIDNAHANGVSVRAERHDIVHDGPVAGAPLVLANLLRPLLLRIARDGFVGEQPQTVIASGLLRHEADEVSAAFVGIGLCEERRLVGGDWAALLLRR